LIFTVPCSTVETILQEITQMSDERTAHDSQNAEGLKEVFSAQASGAQASAGDRSDQDWMAVARQVYGEQFESAPDLSGEFNERASGESSQSQSGESSAEDSATGQASGSEQASAATAQSELPDYAKATYRTEDDASDDASYSASHGFTHGM
jgi:hypothetical protein